MSFFYYVDKSIVDNFNYIKLLNKFKSIMSLVGKKMVCCGKELVEILVDCVLVSDDIFEYIKVKCDFIISEVEKGCSVEEIISLMCVIFG